MLTGRVEVALAALVLQGQALEIELGGRECFSQRFQRHAIALFTIRRKMIDGNPGGCVEHLCCLCQIGHLQGTGDAAENGDGFIDCPVIGLVPVDRVE